MISRFTGRHMLALMIAFFGVVIVVNVMMAMAATRTFGGTVVDNSYVASQEFNGWLDAARRQKALGWSADIRRDGPDADIRLNVAGRPLEGAEVSAVAEHPLGRLADRAIHFRAAGGGNYRSVEALPPGRWRLRVEVRRGREAARFVEDVAA